MAKKTKPSTKRARPSKRPKARRFDIDSFTGISLKSGVVLEEFDPGVELRDPEFVCTALVQCLMDGDAEAAKEVLSGCLRALNQERVVRVSGVSRTALSRMIAPGSNPTLNTLARVCKAISEGARKDSKTRL